MILKRKSEEKYRISKIVFHSEEPENIAMTNLIKCNTGSDKDVTNDDMKSYCIQQNQFIKKELKILLPTHIIFLYKSIL